MADQGAETIEESDVAFDGIGRLYYSIWTRRDGELSTECLRMIMTRVSVLQPPTIRPSGESRCRTAHPGFFFQTRSTYYSLICLIQDLSRGPQLPGLYFTQADELVLRSAPSRGPF